MTLHTIVAFDNIVAFVVPLVAPTEVIGHDVA
jgi:hypothetical protein